MSIASVGFAAGVIALPTTYRTVAMDGDRLVVRLADLPPGYDLEPLRREIIAELEAHGAVPPPIEFRLLDEIPRMPSGKAAVADH